MKKAWCLNYKKSVYALVFFGTISSVYASTIPFAFWKKNSTDSDCPTGYVLVPKNTAYVDEDFCVMTYEAKAETNAGGSFDTNGLSVNLANYKPASVADHQPWREINGNDARTECQSLGANYDLISNAQWQVIARNIELQASNWTSGTVGTGCLFQGNNGETTCGYNASTDPDSGTSRNARAKFTLSNGKEIYDFSGNLWEWVRDVQTLDFGSNSFMSSVTSGSHTTTGKLFDSVFRSAKAQFGPSGSYGSANNNSGLGYAFLGSASGIFRGGGWWLGDRAGPFHVDSYSNITQNYNDTGFRCVYNLTPNPCADAGGKTINGQCWFIGDLGQSCTTVCSSAAGYSTPHIDTTNYSGSSGSNANCTTVLDSFSAGSAAVSTAANDRGCQYRPSNGNRRRGTVSTLNTSSNSNWHRACACSP